MMERFARTPLFSQGERTNFTVIPDGAQSAPIRNLELVRHERPPGRDSGFALKRAPE
jgi:hypothetical protein